MAIHVTTTSAHDLGRSFADATSWHVDDRGYLHITKAGSGNIATFHAGFWVSAVRAEPQPVTAV
jgi:hypothetical protein